MQGDEIARLIAEVKRLREALRSIPHVYEATGSWNANRWKVRRIVSAALNAGGADHAAH